MAWQDAPSNGMTWHGTEWHAIMKHAMKLAMHGMDGRGMLLHAVLRNA